ncbi:MAG: hypothetical protein FWF00_02975 [Endomicrobia bacterium]|nr:hypothetical protein [Endomicrobiia bacterium]MCL2506638.1 hypothetical protein [Endomicrobiia bacterium]
MLRFIHDIARNGAMNMAIDEVLFNGLENGAVLRTYFWDAPYTTIGYFQKNDCNAVRRMTGGLLVNHRDDLSYCFCADTQNWKHIYSQQDTYKAIHYSIKKALEFINISSELAGEQQTTPQNQYCVQTLYSDDLILNGAKIAGSCMRRRGKKIIVQGSLHLDLGEATAREFSWEFSQNIAKILNMGSSRSQLTETELKEAGQLSIEKYSDPQWNEKF